MKDERRRMLSVGGTCLSDLRIVLLGLSRDDHMERFSNRSPAASLDENPSERVLRADVDVINAAHSDLRLSRPSSPAQATQTPHWSRPDEAAADAWPQRQVLVPSP